MWVVDGEGCANPVTRSLCPRSCGSACGDTSRDMEPMRPHVAAVGGGEGGDLDSRPRGEGGGGGGGGRRSRPTPVAKYPGARTGLSHARSEFEPLLNAPVACPVVTAATASEPSSPTILMLMIPMTEKSRLLRIVGQASSQIFS